MIFIQFDRIRLSTSIEIAEQPSRLVEDVRMATETLMHALRIYCHPSCSWDGSPYHTNSERLRPLTIYKVSLGTLNIQPRKIFHTDWLRGQSD